MTALTVRGEDAPPGPSGRRWRPRRLQKQPHTPLCDISTAHGLPTSSLDAGNVGDVDFRAAGGARIPREPVLAPLLSDT